MKAKQIFQILVFALLVGSYKVTAQKQDDNLLEFHLTSMALENGSPSKQYKLTLYTEGEIVESLVLQTNNFEVKLSPDLSNQKKEMLDFPIGYVFYTKENKQLAASDTNRHNINKCNKI